MWRAGREVGRGFIAQRERTTHLIRSEGVLGSSPLAVDLPCGLGGKGGEREPIEILVLLEICKGDDEEAIEEGGGLVLHDALPDLVRELVEERGLVRVLEVLDGIEVLEHAGRADRVLRDAAEVKW